MPYNFTAIEKKWQERWKSDKTFRAFDPKEAGDMPARYVLDMFPYPSGAGLHVGHPLGYVATDIVSRYLRMKGFNVLHPMGWDAFGLPAEQYAIKTGQHPRVTTADNIANFRRQIQMLGLSYDWDREIDTTDPGYYQWTQWIFLQLFNSYFDRMENRARPISHLINQLVNENLVVAPNGRVVINPIHEGMERITGDFRIERLWRELTPEEQRDVIDGQRLAYMDEAPVNWCPALGTVLANEEVIDGRSEVGGFPVERRPMRQWMLRITAYADRLLADLEMLDWPESLKEMQRNWIGRSTGATIEFEIAGATPASPAEGEEGDPGVAPTEEDLIISVFTTRPDTLYGATYMVLAPEHPLVDRITAPTHRKTIEAYRQVAASQSERDRVTESKEKTGVFTGAYAINPINDASIPIYIADYVLMGYGTGAIMAVPAHDQRDYDFAKKLDLPIVYVVCPASGEMPKNRAFERDGIAMNSPLIDGLPTVEAKEKIINILQREGNARRSINYKLRDWLFSRQRYWGEPFPILLDEEGNAYALDERELPVTLPELSDFRPTGTPEPPLSKAPESWLQVERGGRVFRRETNVMPQWAGSCWYYLRFCDPRNEHRFVDPKNERYWMPVDLYVGGVEHAVLHLLYSRFWHKVLYDLGHVSTPEPFMRLVNQGFILGEMDFHVFENAEGVAVSASELSNIREEANADRVMMVGTDATGANCAARRISEEEVEKREGGYVLKSNPAIRVEARAFKMSKSRGNVMNPDEVVRDYGADCFRLYEMYMGPLEAQKPWNTRDIVGMSRFLNSVWRNLIGDEEGSGIRVRGSGNADVPIPDAIERQLHRTIKKVAEDIEQLRFNTAIAELIKLNNEMNKLDSIPRALAENFALMLAPFAPHVAEELWQRLGHKQSLARQPWPVFDPARLVESTMELPVQVNGKLRDKITVAADASEQTILETARQAKGVQSWVAGKQIRKRIYVPKKLVNFVAA